MSLVRKRKKFVLTRKKEKLKNIKRAIARKVEVRIPKCPYCFKPLTKGYKKVVMKAVTPNSRYMSEAIHCTREGCIAAGTEQRAAALVAAQEAQREQLEAKRKKDPKPKRKLGRKGLKATKRGTRKPKRRSLVRN